MILFKDGNAQFRIGKNDMHKKPFSVVGNNKTNNIYVSWDKVWKEENML